MSTHSYTNRLIHETSIYLLQHAHNPVDWYPWSEEAFSKAMEEDKPVLVSIGYAACHWCHVMEKESFEDAATAVIMNEHFINIKIDREERPDLDHIYMDAVQAMTGSGGWPLNIFLTPDKKPFYGGTYFPPVRAFNRASWKETLDAVYEAYKKRKHEITAQADNLTAYIKESNSFGMRRMDETQAAEFFTKEILHQAADNILKTADKVWGGFGKAPKFPQTFTIMFLLRHYYFTKQEESLQQALLSLDKMMQGGMYDQLGGGFARYSTDDKWLAPHFEKMLYDNALLLSALAEAYQLTADEKYKEIIQHTIAFIEREMTTADGGFYSALDADSEGVEGKFYVWQKEEIDEVLGSDSELFCSVYEVTEQRNWEHTNILWLKENIEWHAQQMNITADALKQKLNSCKEKLLLYRAQRIRPLTDDKIITGWNALMITALCKCYAATSNRSYLQLAEKNIRFLEKNCLSENGKWFHTFKNGIAKYNAFLDDYSYLIQAYLHLQEATGDAAYLSSAIELTQHVLKNFADTDSPFFFYTAAEQTDVIVREKEVYDGAVPSGNSVMAQNLLYLSIITGNKEWEQKVVTMLQALGQAVVRYPTSFGVWAMALQNLIEGTNEIAIVGSKAKTLLADVMQLYIPNKVVQASVTADETYPLLQGKMQTADETKIYLCRNYACKQPVDDAASLMQLIKQE